MDVTTFSMDSLLLTEQISVAHLISRGVQTLLSRILNLPLFRIYVLERVICGRLYYLINNLHFRAVNLLATLILGGKHGKTKNTLSCMWEAF